MRNAVLITLLAVVGCTATDPYARYGMWQPTGANAHNIAEMTVNKQDLIHGRGAQGAEPIGPASAIFRFWDGTTRPLQSTTVRTGG